MNANIGEQLVDGALGSIRDAIEIGQRRGKGFGEDRMPSDDPDRQIAKARVLDRKSVV